MLITYYTLLYSHGLVPSTERDPIVARYLLLILLLLSMPSVFFCMHTCPRKGEAIRRVADEIAASVTT